MCLSGSFLDFYFSKLIVPQQLEHKQISYSVKKRLSNEYKENF